eukprot:TRINITY_DN34987_c0_g1_i1.p2 TRINITY_DN34987_c0_g1~~TRINITY_DN34987_c0_g1_i1.p2  ORF type:complete len:164 (+),score=3.47 TRINITY_DN34987_c0_g1_i1:94-585(+)
MCIRDSINAEYMGVQDHQHIGDDAARKLSGEPAVASDQRPQRREQQERKPSGGKDPEQPPVQVFDRIGAGFHSSLDLGLQPSLLVKADFEVRKQHQLCAARGPRFGFGRPVAEERPPAYTQTTCSTGAMPTPQSSSANTMDKPCSPTWQAFTPTQPHKPGNKN